MCKSKRIEARISEQDEKNFKKKAEAYGGVTSFIEEIARKDVIILDKSTTLLLKKLYGNSAVRVL